MGNHRKVKRTMGRFKDNERMSRWHWGYTNVLQQHWQNSQVWVTSQNNDVGNHATTYPYPRTYLITYVPTYLKIQWPILLRMIDYEGETWHELILRFIHPSIHPQHALVMWERLGKWMDDGEMIDGWWWMMVQRLNLKC